MRVEVLVPSQRAKVNLVTLEEQAYELDWTVHSGLQVTSLNGQEATADLASRSFEDLNQFLQCTSALYQKKFNDSLMEKLMGL